MPGPQGRVMVSHLCGQVCDLKAVAVHIEIVIEVSSWLPCRLGYSVVGLIWGENL